MRRRAVALWSNCRSEGASRCCECIAAYGCSKGGGTTGPAVVGGARGAREQQVRNQASQQAAYTAAAAQVEEARATFNKGFAACLEGKHYTVK